MVPAQIDSAVELPASDDLALSSRPIDSSPIDSSPADSGLGMPRSGAVLRDRERPGDPASRNGVTERSQRLLKVTAAIAEAVDVEQVLEAVVDRMASALDATSVGLWFVSDDGEHLNLVRAVGYGPALTQAFDCCRLDRRPAFPAVDAIRENAPIWITSPLEFAHTYPHLAALVAPGSMCSVACLPLVVRDNARGCIAFSFSDERLLDPSERDFLQLVARYTGQAVERLHLLEAERALRTQSEAAAARLELLSRASRAFAEASHDLQRVLGALAEQVTVNYADGCYIALISNGLLELASIQHRDPEAAEEMRAAFVAGAPVVGAGLLGKVASDGRPLLMSEMTPAGLERMTPAGRAWFERHVPTSLVIVPLRLGALVVGTLAAVRHDRQRPFVADDQLLLEELADRASLALSASRLYEANEQGRVRAQLLYELAARVIDAKTVEEVFDAALDGIERALGASRCSILTFDGDQVMRFRAWRGLSEHYRQAVEGHTPWDRQCRDPKPLVVPDVFGDEGLRSFAGLFESERIGALGFIPLVYEQRLVGKFMVYYPAPRALSVAELDMAEAIANHVAAAIGRFSALRELKQTVRFNEIFTGMLGHDLRNPLGAIMTAAEMLMRKSEGGPLEKPLSRIIKSGTRMATMIDHLLDFTRVRVGAGIPIDPQPTDLGPLVKQAIDELSDAYPAWRFSFERDSGDSRGDWDADRLVQVFSNLVANAVQHGTPEPGVSVFVVGSEASEVSVRIHNLGVVPAEILPRLFEPMAGGDRRRDHSRGLGLGLYISREIIEAHGGVIGVETCSQAGTTFTVRLPRSASKSASKSVSQNVPPKREIDTR